VGSRTTYTHPGPKPVKHFPRKPAKLGLIFEISIFFNFREPSHSEVDTGDLLGVFCCTPDVQQTLQVSAVWDSQLLRYRLSNMAPRNLAGKWARKKTVQNTWTAVTPWKVQVILTKFGTAIEGHNSHKKIKNGGKKFLSLVYIIWIFNFDPKFLKKDVMKHFSRLLAFLTKSRVENTYLNRKLVHLRPYWATYFLTSTLGIPNLVSFLDITQLTLQSWLVSLTYLFFVNDRTANLRGRPISWVVLAMQNSLSPKSL